MEFEHETALKDFNTSYSAMPLAIKTRIQNWEREKIKVYSAQEVDPAAERALSAKSAIIANEIQDFIEKDLEDEEEIPNPNNMLSDADKARAKAVGLDENTATVADIEAKEKEKADKEAADKEAADKAAADKEAAEKAAKEKEAGETAAKEAADKEAAEKEAKEKAEKEAAEKAKQTDEDDDDLVDGLM